MVQQFRAFTFPQVQQDLGLAFDEADLFSSVLALSLRAAMVYSPAPCPKARIPDYLL
jgi:hypothetical protein